MKKERIWQAQTIFRCIYTQSRNGGPQEIKAKRLRTVKEEAVDRAPISVKEELAPQGLGEEPAGSPCKKDPYIIAPTQHYSGVFHREMLWQFYAARSSAIVQAHLHTYIGTSLSLCLSLSLSLSLSLCLSLSLSVSLCLSLSLSIYIYICIYAWIYVNIYIYVRVLCVCVRLFMFLCLHAYMYCICYVLYIHIVLA